MDKFYMKNDIGVNIEYTIIGNYVYEGIKYALFTDFVPDNNKVGFRIFVAKNSNGKLDIIKGDKAKEIVKYFNKEIVNFKKYEV